MTSPDPTESKSAASAKGYFADNPSAAPDWFLRIFSVGMAAGGFVVLVHVLQLITAAIRTARREQLFGGLKGFTATILIAAGTVILATVCMRGFVALFGSAAAGFVERRRLNLATRRAHRSVDQKQQLLEERIRLTAQLRATWMFERECYRLANAQARREFRQALQTGVTRSCEIAFDQIGLVIEQYERTVKEIDASALEVADKTELLEKLAEQLNVADTDEKNQSAARLMDAEIWKLRFETADRLRKNSLTAALRYLQQIEATTSPCASRRKLQALVRRWQSEVRVNRPESRAES